MYLLSIISKPNDVFYKCVFEHRNKHRRSVLGKVTPTNDSVGFLKAIFFYLVLATKFIY